MRLAKSEAAKAQLQARQREADGPMLHGAAARMTIAARAVSMATPAGGAASASSEYRRTMRSKGSPIRDSRVMKHGNGAFEQSYDGHTGVDAEQRIIVPAKSSQNGNDYYRLPVLLAAVQANLQALPQQTLADAGFRSKAVLGQFAGAPTDLIVALGREGREDVRLDGLVSGLPRRFLGRRR